MDVLEMVAVQGFYEDGRIQLEEEAPMKKASVIVIFPEERPADKKANELKYRELFNSFTGCISGGIHDR